MKIFAAFSICLALLSFSTLAQSVENNTMEAIGPFKRFCDGYGRPGAKGEDLNAFLEKHRESVIWSIIACGKDQSGIYDRTYISYAYVIMEPGQIGTALTAAPYIVLAQDAVPREGFSKLNEMTLKERKKEIGFE